VSVVGEPGIGKSRLLYEFRRTLSAEDVAHVEGQCVSHGAGAPFLPVIDVLRAACGIADGDPIDAVAATLDRALAGVVPDPEQLRPFLLHLLGGPADERLAPLHPEAASARTVDAFVQFCVALSRRRPLVLAIEDLHWMDRASERKSTRLNSSH